MQYMVKKGRVTTLPTVKYPRPKRQSKLKQKVKMKRLKVSDSFKHMVSICMAQQLSMKRGIKELRQNAINTIFKEYVQLGDLKTFKPAVWQELTREQKLAALRLITMVTQKRCGRYKSRACVDGRPQR